MYSRFFLYFMISIFVARHCVVPSQLGAKELDAAGPSDPATRTDAILVNHVGFLPGSPKYCVVPRPPVKTFTIHRLKDCVWTQVYEGKLVDGGTELESGWVGEFSSLREEGTYQVRCGTRQSRCFVVWRRAYDVPMRVLYNYFPWQRCGDSTTGWAAPCHLDDGRIAETGEHRDLAGGYHQSCDLRKWASLEVCGLIGLTRFAQTQSPRWDDGCVAKELRWGSDYYQKLVREDGGLLDSVFIPMGWGPRDFYLSDAPPPAIWNTIRHQAMLAAYFKSVDTAYSEKCKQVARRVWQYMTSNKRRLEKYKAPALPPLGHDNMNDWYAPFYPGSSFDLAHRLCAAVALYRVTDDPALLEDAARSGSALVDLQVTTDAAGGDDVACFWEGPDHKKIPDFGSYFWHFSAPVGLCELLELKPDHPDSAKWRRAVERIAQQYLRTSRRNPWGLVATRWAQQDQPVPKPPAPTAGARRHVLETYNGGNLGDTGPGRFIVYQYRFGGYNGPIAAAGVFLRRAAAITGKDEYRHVAQRQMDWIFGCNPYDSSAVEGVGYNQPQRGFYGEFFPP
ncbi:MAG: glycoside hydrolase family 9 protein, partial [Pirellulales bacterium]|nr:glycoside hydrolase family 9 protein [Pirellulales bacterium]